MASRLLAAKGAEETVDLKAATHAEHAANLVARMRVGKDRLGTLDFFGKTGQGWLQGPARPKELYW